MTTAIYPELNTDLMRATLAHISEVPEGWDQERWRTLRLDDKGLPKVETVCGTTMCFAGEAVQLHDPNLYLVTAEMIEQAKRDHDTKAADAMAAYAEMCLAPTDAPSYMTVAPHGRQQTLLMMRGLDPSTTRLVHVRERAVDALGISGDEASILFFASNTFAQLEAMVTAMLEDGVRGQDRLAEVWDTYRAPDQEPWDEQ